MHKINDISFYLFRLEKQDPINSTEEGKKREQIKEIEKRKKITKSMRTKTGSFRSIMIMNLSSDWSREKEETQLTAISIQRGGIITDPPKCKQIIREL